MAIDSPSTATKTYKLKKIKQSFTTLLISNLLCPYGKSQALFWDKDTANLGLRITANGSKSFIFEGSLNNQTIRITIGNVSNCSIEAARARAIKLRSLLNQGIDPRKLTNKKVASFISSKALAISRKAKYATFQSAWLEYMAAHEQKWSARRYQQHLKLITTDSTKHDMPVELNALVNLTLTELSDEKVSKWVESALINNQPNTLYTLRVLNVFFVWCNTHEAYQSVISNQFLQDMANLIKASAPHKKPAYLPKNQLTNWFNAVDAIDHHAIKIYLKVLLLTGRREAEIAKLKWSDINFNDQTMRITRNNVTHIIPLTPHVASLLNQMTKSHTRIFNNIADASVAHKNACSDAGLALPIGALRTSFTLFSEWVETPTGITAQIQDIDIKGIGAHHFVERPMPLLQKWHTKIEDWVLEQAAFNAIAEKSIA